MKIKVFTGENPNVKKYVFLKEDAVYEAVIYKYPEYKKRTVICCSVQSGCPVGCVFCGTGKRFIKNLSEREIVSQIYNVLEKEGILDITEKIEKLQVMFMSMGEPMLNWEQVEKALYTLNHEFPNAQLLLSTMGVKDDKTFLKIIETAKEIDKVGLQFSLHNPIDEERNKLIPFKNKYSIREIRDRGQLFYQETGRKPYINYCVSNENSSDKHIEKLLDIFSPLTFCVTFSAICNADKNNKAEKTDYTALYNMQSIFLDGGYNVRVFDPAGKDDIGGGCGQLWFVQEWMKKKAGNNDR